MTMLSVGLGLGVSGCAFFEKSAPEELADLVPPSAEAGATASDLAPAVRLEAVLEAQMQLDLALDEENLESLEAMVAELGSSTFTISLFASEQLSFLVPQLARAGYHLDLSATRSVPTSFELSPEGVLTLGYTATLSVYAPPGSSANPEPLPVVLPGDPWRLRSRAGYRCLEEGQRDAPAETYAFYFDPDRAGCEAAMISVDVHRIEKNLRLRAVEAATPRWPEYDRMAEDGRVEAVVVAGAISPSWETGLPDPTQVELSTLVARLEAMGFSRELGAEGSQIVTLKRTIVKDRKEEIFFEEVITVIGPEALAAGEERGELAQAAIARAEILLLGSEDAADAVLSVLAQPDLETGYQIFVIDGSWRYADQAVEIFSRRSSGSDPRGSADVDLLTNVRPAVVVGRGAREQVILLNLFKGAEVGGIDGDRYFSWDRIVATANLHAREAVGRASKSHAIFGDSGLDGNRFVPAGL